MNFELMYQKWCDCNFSRFYITDVVSNDTKLLLSLQCEGCGKEKALPVDRFGVESNLLFHFENGRFYQLGIFSTDYQITYSYNMIYMVMTDEQGFIYPNGGYAGARLDPMLVSFNLYRIKCGSIPLSFPCDNKVDSLISQYSILNMMEKF